jgi:hypothetical protein
MMLVMQKAIAKILTLMKKRLKNSFKNICKNGHDCGICGCQARNKKIYKKISPTRVSVGSEPI